MAASEIAQWKLGENQHHGGSAKLPTQPQAAKNLAIARIRMERARKEAEALDVLCEAYKKWRADKAAGTKGEK
jgi:hypothetical protein